MTSSSKLPTGSVLIELPWPLKALSPNARSRTYHAKARATALSRQWAFAAAKSVIPPCFKHNGSRLAFVITAYPPTKRHMDDDNLTASCKAYRDGIAQALGIDDALFDQRLQWGEPVKYGKIVVGLA